MAHVSVMAHPGSILAAPARNRAWATVPVQSQTSATKPVLQCAPAQGQAWVKRHAMVPSQNQAERQGLQQSAQLEQAALRAPQAVLTVLTA